MEHYEQVQLFFSYSLKVILSFWVFVIVMAWGIECPDRHWGKHLWSKWPTILTCCGLVIYHIWA
jgi:hypothetical protein